MKPTCSRNILHYIRETHHIPFVFMLITCYTCRIVLVLLYVICVAICICIAWAYDARSLLADPGIN